MNNKEEKLQEHFLQASTLAMSLCGILVNENINVPKEIKEWADEVRSTLANYQINRIDNIMTDCSNQFGSISKNDSEGLSLNRLIVDLMQDLRSNGDALMTHPFIIEEAVSEAMGVYRDAGKKIITRYVNADLVAALSKSD